MNTYRSSPSRKAELTNIDGLGLAYRNIGEPSDNCTTVILGGTFANVFSFQHLERQLSALGSVVLVDLPGCGLGGELPNGTSHLDAVTIFAKFIEIQKLRSINIIGISAGGPIAHAYTALHPHQVNALVLGSAVLFPKERDLEYLEGICILLDKQDAWGMTDLSLEFLMDNDSSRIVRGKATRDLLTLTLRETSIDRMRAMAASLRSSFAEWNERPHFITGVRTLVYTGEYDPYADIESTISLARTVQNSKTYIVAETDHMIHIERPGDLATLISTFLRGELHGHLDFARRISVQDHIEPHGLTDYRENAA